MFVARYVGQHVTPFFLEMLLLLLLLLLLLPC